MSEFVVSARKYRPSQWEAVVGQEGITETLKRSIESDQLAQAYLFCGPRGVGKTSCARLFAKAINIHNGSSADDDFSFNIFELDAASNNSVDDIRSITDQVRIPPQTGTHKVYIIDEVHMLSSQAFNAFLKTLEEPPAHAVFILATTEKHKIIPTILSRCQVYDFNRIQVADMIAHLNAIAEKEGIKVEEEALRVIAIKADGAMRDALSIFDQMVSFCNKDVTYAAVLENLNVLDFQYYFKLVDLFKAEDISNALLTFHEIQSKGFDGHHFLVGLMDHFRNLMVAKDPQTIELIEASQDVKDSLNEQAKKWDIPSLMSALEILNTADVQYKQSKNQRLLVELSLMQLSSLEAGKKKSVN